MIKLSPLTFGMALALTLVSAYAVCSIFFFLSPGVAIEFLNQIFHGLDFSKIEMEASWSLVTVVCVSAVIAIWGFLAGALFAWLHNLIRS